MSRSTGVIWTDKYGGRGTHRLRELGPPRGFGISGDYDPYVPAE